MESATYPSVESSQRRVPAANDRRQSPWRANRQSLIDNRCSHVGYALVKFSTRAALVLRSLIGWHFLYEGYTKLLNPAWGQNGAPLPRWSSAAYLNAATGPLAGLFHWMGNAPWIGSLDLVVAVALTVVGISLILGLFTQVGCSGAMALLAMFYLSAIPTGTVESRAEGTYLLVNKNLIEACAVAVLLAFRTESIAGLDRLWSRSPSATPSVQEAAV